MKSTNEEYFKSNTNERERNKKWEEVVKLRNITQLSSREQRQ